MTTRRLFIMAMFLITACGGAQSSNTSGQTGSATIKDGETLLEQGEFAAAAKVFEKVAANEPGNAEAYYYLGVAKKNLGDVDEAEKQYRLAIGYDANLHAAHNNLGLLLLEKGDYVHAESELHTYLSNSPDDADAHFNYALVLEASGDVGKAEEHYKKAAELNPEDASAYIGLGDLARRENDLEKALSFYRKGKEIAPDSPEATIKEGQTLLDLKRLDDAIPVLESLSGIAECDPGILATAGLLLARFEEDDRAITLYKAAIARDASYASAHFLVANALARKNQFKEAAKHLERFLELAPKAPEAGAARKRLDACRAQMK